MLLPRRRRRHALSADKLTLGLAGVAVATAGTVLVGELVRLARRRVHHETGGKPQPLTAEQALAVTGHVPQDAAAVAREGFHATPRQELVLFHLFTGFVATFAFVRISTHGIRSGWWPVGNVSMGGRHIHHFVPGIVMAFITGGWALLTHSETVEKTLAFPFGAGVALTLDEAALLLDLRDVYWTREGILSVQLSLGVAAIMGGTILALRILDRGERAAEAAHAIPPGIQLSSL